MSFSSCRVIIGQGDPNAMMHMYELLVSYLISSCRNSHPTSKLVQHLFICQHFNGQTFLTPVQEYPNSVHSQIQICGKCIISYAYHAESETAVVKYLMQLPIVMKGSIESVHQFRLARAFTAHLLKDWA